MTKKYGARLCIPNLTRHFFVIVPSWVFQPSCCVSSLMGARLRSKQIACLKSVTLLFILQQQKQYLNKNIYNNRPQYQFLLWISRYYIPLQFPEKKDVKKSLLWSGPLRFQEENKRNIVFFPLCTNGRITINKLFKYLHTLKGCNSSPNGAKISRTLVTISCPATSAILQLASPTWSQSLIPAKIHVNSWTRNTDYELWTVESQFLFSTPFFLLIFCIACFCFFFSS